MSLNVFSSWYYLEPVTSNTKFLNFSEGGGELSSVIVTKHYTHSEILTAITSALNSVGANVYSVTLDRNTRLITISADNNFDLLIGTGSQAGTSVFNLLGFTGADLVGAATYTANLQIGAEYIPQFILQDYMPFDDIQRADKASVSISASGLVKVLKFGDSNFMKCSIMFITNNASTGNYITQNLSGKADALEFCKFTVTKRKLEFHEDINNKSNFDVCLLEKNIKSTKGLDFELEEMLSLKIAGFWKYSKLEFRRIK